MDNNYSPKYQVVISNSTRVYVTNVENCNAINITVSHNK